MPETGAMRRWKTLATRTTKTLTRVQPARCGGHAYRREALPQETARACRFRRPSYTNFVDLASCGMSGIGALLTFLLVCLAIGVDASIVMERRVHDPSMWGALGAALGPLVILAAADSIGREIRCEGSSRTR